MVTNHDDSVFDHHPTPTRGFTETVNWALKHAEFISTDALSQAYLSNKPRFNEKFNSLPDTFLSYYEMVV